MKTISINLIRFAMTAVFLTIAFHYSLKYGIDADSSFITTASGIAYGFAMFVSGWIFGAKDRQDLPLYDVGFRFHFTTYLVHNVVSKLWFVLGFNSRWEDVESIHWTVMIWGVFVLVHFLFYLNARSQTIKGLDKKELFD